MRKCHGARLRVRRRTLQGVMVMMNRVRLLLFCGAGACALAALLLVYKPDLLRTGTRLTATPPLTNVSAIDGDSLRSGTEEIRIMGIDAPELNQPCRDERAAPSDINPVGGNLREHESVRQHAHERDRRGQVPAGRPRRHEA